MKAKISPDLTGYMTRRDFLWVASISTAGFLAGCAANPVTGESQLMLVSEQTEIDIDKKNSPHQYSTDYGITQDKPLNNYIDRIGKSISSRTHRPVMPYSFNVVNATYVNAYAFPGGSIAATRGILLKLDNEAELAGLMGHELGHVNARHTARQMSKGMLTQLALSGISLYANVQAPGYARFIDQLGMLGAGALLAHYSRDNEREADALGLEYMVNSGYSPDGFVGLMDMLNNLSKKKPSSVEILFSTHPMSDERYQTAVDDAHVLYGSREKQPLYEERYMDHTVGLRSIAGAIEEMQKGEKVMAKSNYAEAESHFKEALIQAPNDYTGLVLMAKCMLSQNNYDEALRYAETAKKVYPGEAQAHNLAGYANIRKKKYGLAYEDFDAYERLLPGNPNTIFFKGLTLEGMQRFEQSSREYYRYLQLVREGNKAEYAYNRLLKWGYIR